MPDYSSRWRLAVALLCVACGGGNEGGVPPTPTTPTTPTTPAVRPVRITTGRTITDTIAAIAPIVVEVRDPATGNARAGVEVRLEVLDGGTPSVLETKIVNAIGITNASAVDTTNTLGQVNTRTLLGQIVGVRRIVVSAASVAGADTAMVTVKPGAVVGIRGVPRDTAIILGAQYRLAAETVDRAGNSVAAVSATFTGTTPTICSIGADGTVRGIAYGVCTISASAGGMTQSIQPRITPAGTILVRRGTAVGTLSLDGSGFVKITDVDTLASTNFQWITAGRELAFWETLGPTQTRLVMVGMDGTKRPMAPLPYAPSSRRVSDDGAWIVMAIVEANLLEKTASVARLRGDGTVSQTPGVRCCTGITTRTDISADGTKIAYGDHENGVYINFAASTPTFIGSFASTRFSPDGNQLARVDIGGELIGQDVGTIASPSHTIAGGPGIGPRFDRIANWSPDSKWILANSGVTGGSIWWVVPAAGGRVLDLPRSIGTTYVVLDGWKP